jgi:putative tryptophan/tyrosine transport system substrate-binding protein
MIKTRRVLFLLSPNLCVVSLKFAIRNSKSTILAGAILIALCSLLLALCSSIEAQPTGKIFRIGYLDASTASGNAVLVEAFRQEMRKLGWIEGNNIAIDYRFAEGQTAGQRELAAEFVRLKVDLIVVAGIGPAIAAKRETSTIPIVMASAGNPVAVGLVDSLARPGGNVTGLSTLNPELNTKRLEILKDAVAKLVRVGLLRPPPARCW